MEGDAGLQAVVNGSAKFANNYFKALVKSNPENLITSPLSVQVVVAMAAYGAAGKTSLQMRSALKLPRSNELGQSGYQSLIKTLNFQNGKGVELRLASKLYTASFFTVKPEYEEITSKYFLAPCQTLDFSNPVAAAKVMNTWCEEATNKRLRNIVSPNDLPASTRVILVSAVYFKGQWAKKFEPKLTESKQFHVNESTTKCVPTMYIDKDFRSGELPKMDARFIEIPYLGETLSMIIILPNDINGLSKVVSNLHKVNMKERLRNVFPSYIQLHLPKFKIENDLNLTPILTKMGMSNMFHEDRANFSHMGDVPLNILSVLQTAFIEVNEEGSEAFAYTRQRGGGAPMNPPPPPPTFRVDRPFYYAIYHCDTGISLFTGIVQEPQLK